MYTATSIDVFIAAYSGAEASFYNGRQPGSDVPSSYDRVAYAALAFAEEFDTIFATVLPNQLQLELIESISSEIFEYPQNSTSSRVPATYLKVVNAVIALMTENSAVVAANVTNPIPVPTPVSAQVLNLLTVEGDLRTTTPLTAVAAFVDGYYETGDEGGGSFFWNPTSLAADDGGSVINPTGHVGAGRWIRLISGNLFSAYWWGVKGDGVYTTASINSGSFHATIAGLSLEDIGKGIMIAGAGPSNGNTTPSRTSLTSTILNVVGTDVTLAHASQATVVGAATLIGSDDTDAIQAGADYCTSMLESVAGQGVGVLGSGGVYTTPTLHFGARIHYVTQAISGQGNFSGDPEATIVQGVRTENVLVLTGGGQLVTGLAFGGGFRQILIQQSPLINSLIRIEKCVFRYPYGPAIQQDTSLPGYDRGGAYRLVVKDFNFEGQALYFGELDGCTFEDGFLGLITTIAGVPPLLKDDDGKVLGLFNAGDDLNVVRVSMAPAVDATDRIPWIRLMGACNVHLDTVRFGGEAALPGIRCQDITYLGEPLNYDAGGVNGTANLFLRDCAMTSFVAQNWLEIYVGNFPNVIDLRSSSSSTVSGPDGASCLVNSWGVWVDNGVDMAEVANRNKQACVLHLAGMVDYAAFRFRQSADPTTVIGTDLWPQLRNFADSEPVEYANTLYPLSPASPLDNLYVPNVYDPQTQCDATGSTSAHLHTGAVDYSSGYPITLVESDGTGTQANRFLLKVLGTVANGPWGAGFAAGEYCFSLYVKANWNAEVILSRHGNVSQAQREIAVRHTLQANGWQRICVTFYHDGTGNDFQLQINNWPDTGTLYYGLCMGNVGTVPAKYVFPKGSATAVAAITLPADSATGNTGLEWVGRSTYVRAADPTAGVYVKGDKIEYPEPTPLGYIGAVCTTAGGAGVFAFSKYGFIGTVDCYQNGILTRIVNAGSPLYDISATGTWTPAAGVNTDFVGAGNMRFRTSTGFCFLDAPNPQLRVYGEEGTKQIYLDTNKIQMAMSAGSCFIDVPDIYLRGAGGANERIHTNGTGIGFFAATPVAQQNITGSRGGNAALADLLTKLALTGLITDSTTA